MSVCCINARCKDIVRFLLGCKTYITMQDIAEEVSASKRSIYYDVCKINEWLRTNSIPELEIVRGRGILLSDDQKCAIEKIIETDDCKEDYIFSPTERVRLIICYIIFSSKPVYVEQLSDLCKVSRNTIFNDIKIVMKQLTEYDAKLTYKSRSGYQVEGNPIKVRAMFFYFFEDMLPLIRNGNITCFAGSETESHLEKLREIEKKLQTEYVDGILLSLSALLPIMYQSTEELLFPGLRKKELQQTGEYRLVRDYFPDLREQEQIYLSLHLLGSRVAVIPERMIINDTDQTVYEITKDLVSEFERIACVFFENREELERTLFVHITTSMYRYQYGIQQGNPMKEDVIREYPSLFEITKVVTTHLSQTIGMPISDNEVAYLALHFGAYLKQSDKVDDSLRILIVSANGASPGKMLRKEIKRLIPHASIVNVVASVDEVNVQNICDLVVATSPVRCEVPCIVVHPILSLGDKQAILSHYLIRGKYQENMANRIFESVRPYVDEKDAKTVYQAIDRCLHDAEKTRDLITRNKPDMLYFLEKDRIQMVDFTMDWRQAIRRSGEKLLAEGSIEERYLDSIIAQTEKYGSYMILAPGLYLAHAKPEDGVNCLDLSLTVFPNDVVFPDGKTARFIFMLAAVDQEAHLKILEDVLNYFSDAAFRDYLLRLDDKNEILSSLIHKQIRNL